MMFDLTFRLRGLFPLQAEDISDHVIRVSAGNYKIRHIAVVRPKKCFQGNRCGRWQVSNVLKAGTDFSFPANLMTRTA